MSRWLLCVDDSKGPGSEHFETWVVAGEKYTIRRLEGSLDPNQKRVLLKEIKNPKIKISELGSYAEPGFALRRFVEIDELGNIIQEFNKTAIPILN